MRSGVRNNVSLALVMVICSFINIYEFVDFNIFPAEMLSSVDEMVCIFALSFFFMRKRIMLRWTLYIPIAILVSTIGTIVSNILNFNDIRLYTALVQSIINFKLFLFFLFFLFFYKGSDINAIYLKSLKCLVGVSICGLILNIFAPEMFVYSLHSYAIERDRLVGFQLKPNDLAIFCSFLPIFVLFNTSNRLSSILKSFLISIIFLVILLTTSRTALTVFVLILFFYMLYSRQYKLIAVVAMVLLLTGVLFVDEFQSGFYFTETIRNLSEFRNIETTNYIRVIMMMLGFEILLDMFPFGYGAGNFGTALSYNSPVYEHLGVAGLSFFSEMEGIYDSNFASICGEYGFFGLLVYLVLLYKLARFFSPLSSLITTMIMVVVMFISLSQPIFSYQVNSVNLLLVLFATFISDKKNMVY
jgi:hypothetical protein